MIPLSPENLSLETWKLTRDHAQGVAKQEINETVSRFPFSHK